MIIGQNRPRHIGMLCSLLGYSRQAFYQYRKEAEKQALKQELIIQRVLEIRKTQKRLGTRKLMVLLEPFMQEHEINMGRDAFFALLSAYGLLIRKRQCRVPRTTDSRHWYTMYPNLIKGMVVTGPNQVWVSDITYITLENGFAYLSLVTDMYSHKMVGYYLSENLCAAGCVKALKMALEYLPEGSILIHHSDRGIQYCCAEYVEVLHNKQISISMTQTSDPRDNAIAERVNGILKQEFLEEKYSTISQATRHIAQSIGIYNYQRPHSSVDMLMPAIAHERSGYLKPRWKTYYKTNKKKEVPMPT